MPFTLTRALRVLAASLGLPTSGRRTAASATKAVPPSSRIRTSGTPSFCIPRATAKTGILAAAVSAALEPLEGRAMMSATYYVSPSGNDANSGTSTSSPWKSIAKVSSASLSAGDKVLFQGGQTFSGNLKKTSGSGTAADPITISSYGSGDATLNGGTGNGIYLYNVGGYVISNLNVVGTSGGSSQDGMRLEANAKVGPITVTGCSVSGFYAAGILLLADKSGAGFSAASITHNSVHNNVVAGIFTCAAGTKMSDVYIGYNTAYDNEGTGSGPVCSGNGIMCGELEGGLIEHNVAYDNGASGSGGVGIWAYDSDKVTIQYCASFDNKTTNVDGDGFDFDADTSNSVMQYNYAAGNDGGGFMNDQWENDSKQVNNVIRFNVAQNNGRKGNYGELEVWGKVINAQFYNNTVYDTASTGSSAVRIHNYTITSLFGNGVHFDNNVFVTTGGAAFINVPEAMMTGIQGLTFDGNDYYSSGSSTKMILGNKTYTSLAAFQAAGYEKVGSTAVGSAANPLLVGGGSAGTSISTSTNLASYLSAYQLQKSSPVGKSAVNLKSVLGVTLSGTDLYGHTVSASTVMAGADTLASTTTASPTSNPTPSPTPTPTTTTTLTQRTGTLIGTSGSYENDGNTISKAVDGNLNSYFDSPDGGTDWVGYKLSAAQSVSTIKYAPRAGYAARMVGGVFEASNSPDFTNADILYTVTKAPTAGTLTTVTLSKAVSYQYYRYIAPAKDHCNVAEVAFYG